MPGAAKQHDHCFGALARDDLNVLGVVVCEGKLLISLRQIFEHPTDPGDDAALGRRAKMPHGMFADIEPTDMQNKR